MIIPYNLGTGTLGTCPQIGMKNAIANGMNSALLETELASEKCTLSQHLMAQNMGSIYNQSTPLQQTTVRPTTQLTHCVSIKAQIPKNLE